jgi:hypothetical protein
MPEMASASKHKNETSGSNVRIPDVLMRLVRRIAAQAKLMPGNKAGFSKRIATGGVDMNEVAMLSGSEPRKILQTMIEKKVPAIMSYLSRGKWHVAKVQLTDLGACRVDAKIIPSKNPHPINIKTEQPVGVSLKYGYGKFIFEATVMALEPSEDTTSGGTIILTMPDRIQIVQRRSYFRVEVPKSLKVKVLLWHRKQQNEQPCQDEMSQGSDFGQVPSGKYFQGRLVDISAGGAQVALDAVDTENFSVGQFIGVRFTPMPYERPLMFNARIRNVLPTADGDRVCIGIQIVGLEASLEGREVLTRLVEIVERYYQLSQTGAKHQDFQKAAPAIRDD